MGLLRKGLLLLVVLIIAIKLLFFPSFKDISAPIKNLPTFTEIPIPFVHDYKSGTVPFFGAAVIDVDGDETYEIFIGGGEGQDDVLLSYDGTFTNIIKGTGLSDKASTYGVISLDVNMDDAVDLIIARRNGLFLYMNQHGTFEKREIPLELEVHSVVYSVAPGDINNDGWVDLYVSTFVEPDHFTSATFNDDVHGKSNILLLNTGKNTFVDVTNSSGTAIDQNTFLSLFLDLDNDGWQDLVVATNTDVIRMFRNDHNGTFTEKEFGGNGFWMGLTHADVDNDGDQDLFLSNVGGFAPRFLLRGDLEDDEILDTDWALLMNEGDFKFTNHNENFRDLEFAWGAVFEDFNLDGQADLLVSENYIKWFAHKFVKSPGRFFLQNDGQFVSVETLAGLANPHYGMSPLVVDINNDGAYDVILLNIDGPARAFLNDGTYAGTLVRMPDSVASLGATVRMNDVSRVFTPGQGFMTDQTPQMIFPGKGRPIISRLR